MQDMLSRMNPGEFIGLCAVVIGAGGGVLIALTGMIGGFWYSARKAEAEAGLKRELVAAGLSAEDVERVVNATTGGAAATDLAKARIVAEQEKVKARGY